jgi:4-amino-4-deoxy-L-arabinose transferase-like glycosyltransferase
LIDIETRRMSDAPPRGFVVGSISRLNRLPTIAGLSIWLVAGGVAIEGQLLATSARPEDARLWLIAAALLGFASVRFIERDLPEPKEEARTPADARREPSSRVRRRRIGGFGVMALGGLYSILATVLLVMRAPPAAATWLWLFGLLACVTGAILIGTQPVKLKLGWPTLRVPRLLEIGALLAVVGVAIWLRIPDLATIPPNVHGDEADVGLLARDILAGRMPVLFATAPAAEAAALTFAIHAATMRVFGDNLFGLRMGAAIEGVLSVILLYLVARRLWGPRPAVLAAAFMAVAAWHIHFSRTGFHYMQSPLAMLLALYFMVRGLQDRRALDWLLCGFSLGVCIDVYYAARLAPVIVAVYLGYRVVTERAFLRTHLPGILAMTFGAFVFLAPMAAVYGRSEGSFIQRAAAVLVTSPSNLEHELNAYHVKTVPEVLAIQAQHSVEAFHIRGETSLEYGRNGPLFDFWTGALLAMGSIAILLRLGSSRGVLLASWFWIALFLGSVMTTDALFSPHLVVAIPALVLAPALMLDYAWRGVSSLTGRIGTYVFAVPVVVLLGLALQGNIHDYFQVQVVERQPAGRFSLLSNYASSIADRYRLYVIGRSDWTLNYDTPRFLVPTRDAVDVRTAPLALPLDRIPATAGVAFLVENSADDYVERMATIRRAYPDGQEEIVFERPGSPTFTSYRVDNAAVSAANPAATRD